MPTDKPSIMSYLEPALYEKLLELKERRGAKSLSQTVEEILKEYFGGAISSTLSSALFLEQQRQLAQQVTWLVEDYQTLRDSVADLQKIILAATSASHVSSTQLDFFSEEFAAKQIAQRLSQQKRESELIKGKRYLKSSAQQTQTSSNLTVVAIKKGLTGTQLANRLNIHASSLSRRRSRSNFSHWSQQLDPDNIAWTYNAFVRKFYPIDRVNLDSSDNCI